jgi:hypothetical protein
VANDIQTNIKLAILFALVKAPLLYYAVVTLESSELYGGIDTNAWAPAINAVIIL